MQFVALLIGVALVVKYWWLIAGIIGVIVVVHWGRHAVDRHGERVEAERRRVAELVARCDERNAWLFAGDERGLYGEYSPVAM